MAEIFREALKFPTDVSSVYYFLLDTLCRRGRYAWFLRLYKY